MDTMKETSNKNDCGKILDPFYEELMFSFIKKMENSTWTKELEEDLKKMYNILER